MGVVVESAPPKELLPLIAIYNKQMTEYFGKHQNTLSKTLGLGGSLSNAESSITWLATGDTANMSTVCVSLAEKSLQIINANKPEGWKSGLLSTGVDNFAEHHAAIVWKDGQHWKTGLVFDSWPEQKPKTFSFATWWLEFYAMSTMGKPRVSRIN